MKDDIFSVLGPSTPNINVNDAGEIRIFEIKWKKNSLIEFPIQQASQRCGDSLSQETRCPQRHLVPSIFIRQSMQNATLSVHVVSFIDFSSFHDSTQHFTKNRFPKVSVNYFLASSVSPQQAGAGKTSNTSGSASIDFKTFKPMCFQLEYNRRPMPK